MRNDIVFGILLTMLESKKTSAKELSYKFEISTRTVYRYIDVLCQAGVPIISKTGAHGGIWLSENYVLERNYFTSDEYRRLLAALQSLPGTETDFQNKMLIDKIQSMSNITEKEFVLKNDQLFVNTIGFSTFRNKMGVLQKAVFGQTVLHITYHSRAGEITERDIEPHAFMLEGGVWYVYAFCRLRGLFRMFKVSRIATIESLNDTFEKKSIEPPARDDGEQPEKTAVLDISLLVEEKSRLDVEEWLGIENVTKSAGRYYASCRMPFDNELISKLLSFGDGVQIVAPAELKHAVHNALKNMLKIYES